eukprot:15366596-Ditylum_brightwellii.AAC.2
MPQCKGSKSVKDIQAATKWPHASQRVIRASAATNSILEDVSRKIRSNSLVILASSSHRFQPNFVWRSASLVQPGHSMYVPTLAHDSKLNVHVVASEDIKDERNLDKLKAKLHLIHMKDPDLQKAA